MLHVPVFPCLPLPFLRLPCLAFPCAGRVNATVLKQYMPPPGEGTMILMCGPPVMIEGITKILLEELGYTKEMLWDFEKPPKLVARPVKRDALLEEYAAQAAAAQAAAPGAAAAAAGAAGSGPRAKL